ncbi:TRAP transporter 4TM/12TM fusion protein [Caldalkalibacillus uzonensis]|uniref:TRAP transporter 4TM/12TM fusion protein n=1 Tax=Caldalkalibacillus uzonensis TaxID=353224 RepID=A0ABU0CXC7_9BACI|nr:TRAP transporter permease [Caldalkalibacillus uzonensis]MDQ0340741.1 TRAP transporter 4TM/12TM fusion protein [Caldalkalibacillus uzonensis]
MAQRNNKGLAKDTAKKIDLSMEKESLTTNIDKAIYNPDQVSVLTRVARLATALLAICLAIYIIYSAAFGGLPSWQHRAVFTSVLLILCFSYVPYKKGNKQWHWLFDGLPLVLSIFILLFVYFSYPEVSLRQGNPSLLDKLVATTMVALVIEGVRRTVGLAMAVLVLFFWLYIFIGPWFPGLLGHQGFSYRRMTDTMFITTNGIFSDPIYVASTILILFLLFAALLLRTGAGQFFIELAFALTGRFRGGPALASVLSSGMMATITGNGAANATMTGSFTIPLMKKVGYSCNFSGAVEAVASQGGQIMPPIMGASAFIMAEYTGIPYIQIAGYALAPAVLYFLVAGIVIYLQARKQGLEGIPREQLPNLWTVLYSRGYLILPLFIIIFMMVKGYSPMMAGLWAIISVFVLSLLRKETRLSMIELLAALEAGIRNSISTVMACAGAGIIAGSIIMTGLGTRFSRFAIELSGGELLPMLLMIMLASIILGMGMPTISAYVILATVAVGGLVQIGVPVISAHFFVFYFGIMSGITPPVAITSYITAGIAGGDPLKTAFQSLRIGMAGFIIPYMLVYKPALILEGSTADIIIGLVTAALGLVSFASCIQGYLVTGTSLWQRVLLLVSSLFLVTTSIVASIIGVILLFGVCVAQWSARIKQTKSQHDIKSL